MSTRIDIRRWERPDRPQAVYKGALNLWEAPLYVPIGHAQRNSVRTPERKTDRTFILQTVPDDGWVDTPVDALVATWAGIFQGARNTYRAGESPRLNVRDYTPEIGWLVSTQAVGPTVAQLWPAIAQTSARTADGPKLSVRSSDAEIGWLVSTQVAGPTTAQLWPAISQPSARTATVLSLDVRRSDLVRLEWLGQQPTLDQRWPAVQALATRTGTRASLDVRAVDAPRQDWLVSALVVAPTVAQTWPAVLWGLNPSYRAAARAGLDVRGHAWMPPESSWIVAGSQPTPPPVVDPDYWRGRPWRGHPKVAWPLDGALR